MGIWISMCPKGAKPRTPDDLAWELIEEFDFQVSEAWVIKKTGCVEDGRKIEFDSVPADKIYFKEDYEIEWGSSFDCGCAAWQRLSWATSDESYRTALSYLLYLAG